ncbi:cysteine desulfurase family protein, partial [Helcococcus ovis]|uniref:cysteine desulfurase family protein n=2 Tax=Peptoniphilaceae TaxID=1570339 RepID=UPI0038BD1ABB
QRRYFMIYFDNASTTKMDEVVKNAVDEAYEKYWANPSSLHSLGFNVEKEIKKSRDIIAKKLNINPKSLFFVPSGTIANNSVINSIKNNKKNIVISSVEHACVFNAAKNSEMEVRIVNVDKFGFVDEEDLYSKIDDNTVLVSIIHVNNELGTINNINKLAEISKNKNPKILFHSDGVQAFNKINVDLRNIDFYTISSHKINGPKGIAALYIKNAKIFNSLYFGGGQESNLFSGTENVQGIIGFAKASQLDNNFVYISNINKYLRQELSSMKGIVINSPIDNVSPYILNVCFEKIGAEILLHYLEMDDIYISTGSACSKDKGSRVLEAINVEKNYKEGCIRISLSKNSTMDEAKLFVKKLEEKVEIIRGILG